MGKVLRVLCIPLSTAYGVAFGSESLLAFREDDFVDKEENDHRHAAV